MSPEATTVAASVGSEIRPWRPTPFREFILKVAQRCNLACDYCYVYTKADQSWSNAPPFMSSATWQAAGKRIAEHATRHGLGNVRVIFHGGEPLLIGAPSLARIAEEIRAIMPPSCHTTFAVQTNGVLLTATTLTVLRNHGVEVGVSVDGSMGDHDRHRRYADGRGSFRAVDAALRRLGTPPYRPIFGGLLCTVDLRSDPVECYEHLLEYRPPSLDLLLPHAHWGEPPDRLVGRTFAQWLIAVFDRWFVAPRKETSIRLFDEIINLVLGGASHTELVGLSPVALVVVDSDGAIQQVDTLKSTFAGAMDTGLDVRRHPFDAALRHPGVVARQLGLAGLCATCQSCPVRRICGGGNYPHRYRPGFGFDNPSVYCQDLRELIEHIGRRVRAGLEAHTRVPHD